MKAILIDPHTKAIYEVEHDGSLDSIYLHLDVGMIDAVRLDNGDVIYVDDNGLLGDLSQQAFFIFDERPLAGKGLVVGMDEEGNDAAPTLTLNEVIARTRWITLEELRATL